MGVKSMLEKLLGFDNIPRKQKPFTNFVKNSLKIWDDKKIAEIWDVISIANSVPNASNSEAHNTQKDAEPPSEPPPPPLPSMSRKRKCCGWKQALDDELQSVGGKLSWTKLRDALVARRNEAEDDTIDMTAEEIGYQVLANIPESYLSKDDDVVRLLGA